MPEKKFWRYNVCRDIHFGMAGPERCWCGLFVKRK
jgi:hypothetical protein